jgi:hypothetical protein
MSSNLFLPQGKNQKEGLSGIRDYGQMAVTLKMPRVIPAPGKTVCKRGDIGRV